MGLLAEFNQRIGNDIVDLKAGVFESERAFTRFRDRVCTARERRWLVANFSGDPSGRLRGIWSLWAAKEAVYKARSMPETPGAVFEFPMDFVPRNIEIVSDPSIKSARVRLRSRSAAEFIRTDLIVRFRHSASWVHALCYRRAARQPFVWIGRQDPARAGQALARDESRAVRDLCLERISLAAGIPREELSIHGGRASGRAPWLKYRGGPARRARRSAISLSHDGEWLAGASPRSFRKTSTGTGTSE
ncbi:MAG: 4'-phosphopantetheinyl transferase superfamily protein [Leptospirales bacterium]|jgi:phosphopantetheinyl transferase (holo-ACP synthase)